MLSTPEYNPEGKLMVEYTPPPPPVTRLPVSKETTLRLTENEAMRAKAGLPYTIRYASHTPGRNAPCACDSGVKYKRCCGKAVRPTLYDLSAEQRAAAESLARIHPNTQIGYKRDPFTFIVYGSSGPDLHLGFPVEYVDG